MFAEVRPRTSAEYSHVAEPNIRPNSSAELRRLPNFGPSLLHTGITMSIIAKAKLILPTLHSKLA